MKLIPVNQLKVYNESGDYKPHTNRKGFNKTMLTKRVKVRPKIPQKKLAVTLTTEQYVEYYYNLNEARIKFV